MAVGTGPRLSRYVQESEGIAEFSIVTIKPFDRKMLQQ